MIIKKMVNLIMKIFESLFFKKVLVESGEFCVSFGDHCFEICVPEDREILEVYINIIDDSSIGCSQICGGEVSKAGYTIGDDGIIFYVDIKSNICKVKWFYTYLD